MGGKGCPIDTCLSLSILGGQVGTGTEVGLQPAADSRSGIFA